MFRSQPLVKISSGLNSSKSRSASLKNSFHLSSSRGVYKRSRAWRLSLGNKQGFLTRKNSCREEKQFSDRHRSERNSSSRQATSDSPISFKPRRTCSKRQRTLPKKRQSLVSGKQTSSERQTNLRRHQLKTRNCGLSI